MIQLPKNRANGNATGITLIFSILLKVLSRSDVQNIDFLKVTTEYNPEKDIAFLSGDGDFVTLSKGSYGVFFPQDAHMPKVAPGNKPGKVKKVVLKIKI